MRTPKEIREEIEDKLAIFKAGARLNFDTQPEGILPLACDEFRVMKVEPIYREDGSEEAVHFYLGYAPAGWQNSRFGALRVLKALSWNWTDEYEVEIELDGRMMNRAKQMKIELLIPSASRIDEALAQELKNWHSSEAKKLADKALDDEYKAMYEMIREKS